MTSERKSRKPYVISEDIHILLSEWAKRRGFTIPPDKFFKQLRQKMQECLEKIFGVGNVDMVSARELRTGMRKFIRQTGLPAVSMDRVYIRTNPKIQVSRMIDESLTHWDIGPRFGALPISEQLLRVKERFDEIVLVDDVIFSGEVITEILRSLEAIGVKVPIVVAGIAIGKGARMLKAATNSMFLTTRYYKDIIDEICERDFYPGIPLSGRLVKRRVVETYYSTCAAGDSEEYFDYYWVDTTKETGAPYLYPFGKPNIWASIPKDKEKKFSIFCL